MNSPHLIKSLNPIRSFEETSVLPKSFKYQNTFSERREIFGSPEVSFYEFGITTNRCSVEVSPIKYSSSQDSIAEIGIGKVSLNAISTTQVNSSQIGITEISSIQVNTKHFSSTEVGMAQVGATQINTYQIGSAQVNFPQIFSIQPGRTDSNPSKVSLSSRISLKQLSTIDKLSFIFHNLPLGSTDIYIWVYEQKLLQFLERLWNPQSKE